MDRLPFGAWLLLLGPLLAQQPTCRLAGRVTDPMQRPVAGALVTAEESGAVLARTWSDAEGCFVLGKLPYRVVSLHAATDAPDVGAEWVDLLGLPDHFVTIVTMPARHVRGIVRNQDGAPVPHAWVVAAPTDCDRLALASCLAQADEHGAYVLPHVPFGRNLVRAWAPEHDAFEGTVDGTADAEVSCRLETDAVQERTFVLAGASAAQAATARLDVGVQVRGFPLPLPPPLRRPPLVAGRWVVRGWPFTDTMTAHATLPGHGVTPPAFLIPADTGSRSRTFTVDDESGVVRGKLGGTNDARTTWLVVSGDATEGCPVRFLGQPAADGSFVLPAPAVEGAMVRFRVVSPELVLRRQGESARVWNDAQHRPGHSHALPVYSAYLLRLRAAGGDGAAAAGARVTILLVKEGQQGSRRTRAIATGTTRLDGSLAIAGLDLDQEQKLLCVVESADGCASRAFTVGANKVIDLGEMDLTEGAAVIVECWHADGTPAGGTRLDATLSTPTGIHSFVACSDRSGRARFTGVANGWFQVGVFGATTEEQVVEVQPGEVHTIRLQVDNR